MTKPLDGLGPFGRGLVVKVVEDGFDKVEVGGGFAMFCFGG
jgi:hypothetical protein